MDMQKEQADLTRDKIKELIKDLEPGTMLILETGGNTPSDLKEKTDRLDE